MDRMDPSLSRQQHHRPPGRHTISRRRPVGCRAVSPTHPAGVSPPLSSVQKQLEKLEITKTNEIHLSGGTSTSGVSSSDSSEPAGPCTWQPNARHRQLRGRGSPGAAARGGGGGGSCRGRARRGAAGDALPSRHCCEVPHDDLNSVSSTSRSEHNSSSASSSSGDESAAARGPGGEGAAGRCHQDCGQGCLQGCQHGQHAYQPAQAHPYKQDVEHKGRSFSVEQMWRIERENQDLLRRLRACRRVAPPSAPVHIRRITASSAINRTARQREIDRENRIIRRRLQDIQQSSSLLGLSSPSARRGRGRGATNRTMSVRQGQGGQGQEGPLRE